MSLLKLAEEQYLPVLFDLLRREFVELLLLGLFNEKFVENPKRVFRKRRALLIVHHFVICF